MTLYTACMTAYQEFGQTFHRLSYPQMRPWQRTSSGGVAILVKNHFVHSTKPILDNSHQVKLKDKNRIHDRWERTRDSNLKRQFWRQIRDEIGQFKDFSYSDFIAKAKYNGRSAWKVTRSLCRRNKVCIPNLKSGNALYNSDLEKADFLASSIKDQSLCFYRPRKMRTPTDVDHSLSRLRTPSDDFERTTSAEICSVIDSLKNCKTPGSDGIGNKTLKLFSLFIT